MNLGRVNSITHIMTFTIGDVGYQALGLAELLTDKLYNIYVAHFVMTADVVNFAYATIVYDKVNSLAVVFNIEPVADIDTLAINRERLIVESIQMNMN